MDPSKRNAAALHQRVESLIEDLFQHYQTIIQHAAEDETADYSRTAQKELAIKEESAALITTAQNTTMLIRDLQELWLFGSLDTLSHPADAHAHREHALQIARLVEALAKRPPKQQAQERATATRTTRHLNHSDSRRRIGTGEDGRVGDDMSPTLPTVGWGR